MATTWVEDGDCADVGLALRAWATDVLPGIDHELRTPLTTMSGWCDVLLTGELGELSDEQRDAVARIARAGMALVEAIALVEDEVEESLVSGVAAICHRCDVRSWPVPPTGVRRQGSSSPRVTDLQLVPNPLG